MPLLQRWTGAVALASVVVIGLGTGAAGAGSAPRKTKVVLSEWIVKPKPKSVAAGTVKVKARNLGGEDHELVIVRADDPDSLPVDEHGAVVEDEVEDDIVGEIEDVSAGTKSADKFELEPGSYVVFCNIVEEEDDGSVESHFANGMANTLTVR